MAGTDAGQERGDAVVEPFDFASLSSVARNIGEWGRNLGPGWMARR